MGLFIRIDVDKPYGHKNILFKLLSKINEDFIRLFLPKIYLKGLISLLEYLNENNIQSNIYFRNCTRPSPKVMDLLLKGNHSIGFHAENTRTKDTFREELNLFQKKTGIKINHFTKHGSGTLKLGKNHYHPYEPEKYLEWSKQMNLLYKFGNGTLDEKIALDESFISDMFWGESWYRNELFNSIDTLVSEAEKMNYVFLIHPSNYETHQSVQSEFKYFIQQLKENNIVIKTL
ncbi:MAG: hypothetical protein JXR05_11770 [Flavobacteriaceae bacterium]